MKGFGANGQFKIITKSPALPAGGPPVARRRAPRTTGLKPARVPALARSKVFFYWPTISELDQFRSGRSFVMVVSPGCFTW